ncbi:probable ectonucleoside triphosphate diphosphohydrolase 5 at N-terminal half [Coccomyxa sp. Obi]|nr:probable ectonucleoside triphosphate diphosphohydrolase 5 at N-terminal half [Coccomyxa sp. Obi]
MSTFARSQVGQTASRFAASCQGLAGRRTLLLVLLTALVLCSVWVGLRYRQHPEYVLVIDSGSSGTRIFAYQWRDNGPKLPTLTAVSIQAAKHKIPRRAAGDKRAYERLETEPGLDRFVADAEGLEQRALRPLLEWAEAVVPRRQWHRTPLFLFGTAGLRKLPAEGRAALLDDVRAALSRCNFRFEASYAKVISGEEEGVYGWIAVNYLNGHLAPSALPAPVVMHGQEAASKEEAASEESVAGAGNAAELGVETVGTLDLGGSSLEITFLPTGESAAEATTNVSIMGVQYPLYTHVHHGYGLNDAFDKSVAMLLESSQANSEQLPPGDRLDQAPSREPPFGAWEEGGPPETPEQKRSTASEGRTPGAPSLNRNPDAMKTFQMRDEGLGRAPRGLLQADEMARSGMDDAESFGSGYMQQIGGHGTATISKASSWRSLLESKAASNEGQAESVPQMGHRSLQLAAPALSEPLAEAVATEGGMKSGSSAQTAAARRAPAYKAPGADNMLAGIVDSAGLVAEATGEVKYGTRGVARLGGELQDMAERSSKGGRKVEDVAEEHVRLGGTAMSERRRLTEPHVVEHPCLHKGYSAPYRRMVSHGVLPKPATVQLVGRPDYEACAAVAQSVLSTSDCGAAHCVLGAAQPQSSSNFFALTGFFVVFHFFGLPADAGLSDLERVGREHCGLDWEHLKRSRGAEMHVDKYCFRVPYIISLLRKGLAISEDRIRIGNGKEGWTLGAALAEGGRVGIGRPLMDKEEADYKQFIYYFALAAAAMCVFVLVLKTGTEVFTRSVDLSHRSDSLDPPEKPPQTSHHLPPPVFPTSRMVTVPSQKPAKAPSPPGLFAAPVPLQRPTGTALNVGPQAVNYYSKLSLNSSRKRQPSIDNLRGLDMPS